MHVLWVLNEDGSETGIRGKNELRFLRAIAPQLPLPIPVPHFLGQASDSYPHPFVGYERIAGISACGAELSIEQRAALAEPLADTLRVLHGLKLSPELESQAPADTLGRSQLARRLPLLLDKLTRLPLEHVRSWPAGCS